MSSIDPEIMHRLENATVPRPSDSRAALTEINRLTKRVDELQAMGNALVNSLEMGMVQTAKILMEDWKRANRG